MRLLWIYKETERLRVLILKTVGTRNASEIGLILDIKKGELDKGTWLEQPSDSG
jgi:hypothetical protein